MKAAKTQFDFKSQDITIKEKQSLGKKLLIVLTIVIALSGQVKATFTRGVCDLLKETLDIPPIVTAYQEMPDLIVSNTYLANTMAHAIASPLAFIAATDAAAPSGVIPGLVQAREAAIAFINSAPLPDVAAAGVTSVGGWGLVDPTTTRGIIFAAPGAPSVTAGAPLVTAGAIPVHIAQAKLAAARLIIATGQAANAVITKGAHALPLLLNTAAIRAGAVLAALKADVITVGRQPSDATANAARQTAVDNIVAAFLNVTGAAVVSKVFVTPIYDPAENLWQHMIERAHLWKIPSNLATAAADAININYLAWTRAARVESGNLPSPTAEQSSFVVEPATPFSVHFQNVLAVTTVTAQPPQVSWNNTLDGIPQALGGPLQAAWGVHIHLDIGAVAGSAIKANIMAAPLNAQPTRVVALGTQVFPPSPLLSAAGISPIQVAPQTRNELIADLREVAAARAILGAPGGGPVGGLFLPLLGSSALVSTAAAPQPVRLVTIYVENDATIRTLFPR